MIDAVLRAMIVAEAKTWEKTPYVHQASLKGIGTDCIGLIAGIGRNVGIKEAPAFLKDQRFRAYSAMPDVALLLEACAKYLDPVKLGQEQPGDIYLMRFKRDPQHFALLSGADSIIHAYAQIGKVVEHGVDDKWRARIMACYSYRGL